MRERLAARAGLCVLVLGLLTTRGLESADAAVHLDLALAILDRGETSLSIDPGALWVPSRPLAGGLFYQREGELRSASAPGTAWLALPLVAAASIVDRELPSFDALFAGGEPRAVLRPLQARPRVIGFVLLGPICAALAAFFLVLAARALELSRAATLAAVLALALGSPLLAYAGTQWTQLPVTAGLSFVLWRLAAREASSAARVWPLAIGGALVLLVRPDQLAIVIVAGATLYRIERGWRRSPSRSMMRFVVPPAIALAILAFTGLPENGGGWSIARVPEGLLGLVASPRTGLLVYAPFVLLVPLGLARMKQRPIAIFAAAQIAITIVIYAGWFDWGASLAYGPRFLVPILPACALALGACVDAAPRLRPAAWIAIGAGFLVQLPGALLVHARIEEPERFLAPTFALAWRALLSDPAVGRGVDCACTYVPAYLVLAALASLIGVILERARVR